jgi:DNA-binding MarR family transcriptional regulator
MNRRALSSGRKLSEPATLRRMAWFRYRLRRFLRFSERAARTCGVTPQQHQLLLGVAGYTGRGWATISELAEFLQERHNAVVGLVQRAESRGLVCKQPGAADRRYVRVRLTPRGQAALERLTSMHLEELRGLEAPMLKQHFKARPRLIPAAQGA